MAVGIRLWMNIRLGLGAFFLGILGAFFVWSLLWALDSRRELAFDIPGEIHVLRMVEGPQEVTAAKAASAQQRLVSYLREQSLVLVVTTPGDGPPELRVFDPLGVLSWLPRDAADALATSTGNAYLFTGTYSAQRWAQSAATPLIPQGIAVDGAISPPPGAAELQYATGITHSPLLSGTYTLSALDPQQTARVVGLLDEAGLVTQSDQRVPLIEYLARNPLLMVTAALVLMGHACAVLSWVLLLRGRAREFEIRRRHGARGRSLVAQNVVGGLPGLVLGTALGVVASGVLVAVVGHVSLAARDVQALAAAGVAALVVVVAAWSTTLCVTAWSRVEAHRAA